MNNETTLEKARKAQQQADALTQEVASLQSNYNQSESNRSALEKQVHIVCVCVIVISVLDMQVKELRERLEEAENAGVRKMKAHLAAMESRVVSLEEERDTAQKLVKHTA